ncbi:MAG TPA: ATPase domain-containing protein [Rudaea sp.]|nr:ATPase domain-containing protein [Rudaea sp.]
MISSTSILSRVTTGIPGMDEVLGGGLPEFSFNLIAGAPGSGKTTLAHQIMFALATRERPALYFTILGEPPLKMLRYQQQFEFFNPDKVNDAVRFISLSETMASGNLSALLQQIVEQVEKYTPSLVFVDSFHSLAQGPEPEFAGLQQFVQNLAVLMTSWQATTFLIGEYFGGSDPNPVFTVADGLIWLRQSVQRNSVVRKMEIMKMRGQATLPGLHTFRIGSDGIKVFAPANISVPQESGPPRGTERLRMGVPGLDDMMGGGLPPGYSLLIAGPSGSGKSILAWAFLAAGAANGETGVIAAFEQRSNFLRPAAIADLIASDRVGLIRPALTDLSVDEIASLLMAEVGRIRATRVVIDSLSALELALAPTFRDDFRESLSRMLSALASTGVSVLMTSELEDRYTDLRFSPYGTAFLSDAIIVQRYVEIDSRLQRVLAVVKVRASAHSSQLRFFHIDDSGIKLDAMSPDQEGILGGRPTRRRGRAPTLDAAVDAP